MGSNPTLSAITTFTYNTNKQLLGISSPNNVGHSYGYDTQGRISSIADSIAGSRFLTTFTYDNLGRLSTRTHPSVIAETIGYNGNGYMATISAGGSTRYTVTGMNARQQLTGSTYGSTTAVTETYGFDAYGYPLSQDAKAGSVYKQDYRYVFEPITGTLTSRQNFLQNKFESFTYDNTIDRLLTVTGPQSLTMTYNTNGNINTLSDIGTVAFSYGNGNRNLGDNYYYLPKYEAKDIGYPGGAIVYKSAEKNIFKEVKIEGEVINVKSDLVYGPFNKKDYQKK